MRALVIGNGRSRLQFDLHELKKSFTTYGCNALYRDFIPHVLVSMDDNMVNEIIQNGAHKKCKFYTQHMNEFDTLISLGEPINFVKTYPSTPDSGTAAVDLACKDHNIIVLIGFDYNNGQHNNVYAGTHNYLPVNYAVPLTQNGYWQSRLASIVKKYVDVTFIRVTDEKYEGTLTNFQHMTIEQFKELP